MNRNPNTMNAKLIPLVAFLLVTLTACGESKNSFSASEPPAAPAKHAGEEAEGDDEHGHEGEGHVELTADQIRTAGIEFATVGPAPIRETLPLYGAIAPNAERVREVSARFPGVLRSVTKKIGDTVSQGEALATIESNESLQTYTLAAPLSGVITQRYANAGEQTGEKSLFTVADLSTVWVEMSLFPRDLAKIHVGQGVRVSSVDAGLNAQGKVVYVAPFGSSASQTLTARVQLDNPDRKWAPGLYVSAEVTLAENPAALTVRNEAVQTIEERSAVFVEHEAGEFEPRTVRLGRTDGEISEVVEGLQAGERYVTRNSFILKSQLGAGSAEHEH